MNRTVTLAAASILARLTGEEFAFWVLGFAAVLVALHQIRKHLLAPAWELNEVLVDMKRAHPILMEIAKEFEPNDGKTLHDKIAGIEDALARERRERTSIQDDVVEIRNMVRIHIADRLPGGMRHTDPQPSEEPPP